MLEHGDFIPGVERHDRPKDRGQILGFTKHGLPLRQPLVLIPVEIVDKRILFRSGFGPTRLLRLFDRGLGSGEHSIDRGKRITQPINVGIFRLPYPNRSVAHLNSPLRHPLRISTQ